MLPITVLFSKNEEKATEKKIITSIKMKNWTSKRLKSLFLINSHRQGDLCPHLQCLNSLRKTNSMSTIKRIHSARAVRAWFSKPATCWDAIQCQKGTLPCLRYAIFDADAYSWQSFDYFLHRRLIGESKHNRSCNKKTKKKLITKEETQQQRLTKGLTSDRTT